MIFKPSTLLSRGSKSLQRQSNDNLKKKSFILFKTFWLLGFILRAGGRVLKLGCEGNIMRQKAKEIRIIKEGVGPSTVIQQSRIRSQRSKDRAGIHSTV